MQRFASAMFGVVLMICLTAWLPPRFDYPFMARPSFGVLEWTEISPEGRSAIFSLGLAGRSEPLIYNCSRRCLPFNSLRELAGAAPPLEVRYTAMGNELVMLTVDGRKVIRPWLEQIRFVWLRLVPPVLAFFLAIIAFRRLIIEDRLSEAST